GALGGANLPAGINGEPFGRIDLVGITLDVFGPGGNQGPRDLVNFIISSHLGTSDGNSTIGSFMTGGGQQLGGASGNMNLAQNNVDLLPGGAGGSTGATTLDGLLAQEGFIVAPKNAVAPPITPGAPTLTAADVGRIIDQGLSEAVKIRAAIRLPISV